MPCACGGANSDANAEFEVRLPDGSLKVVIGKPAAEALIARSGGGSLVKKRS